jgi:hypothetical protein
MNEPRILTRILIPTHPLAAVSAITGMRRLGDFGPSIDASTSVCEVGGVASGPRSRAGRLSSH